MIATVKEERGQLTLNWQVDPVRRRLLERTRLGRRVLCTDHHVWSTGCIVYAFRGQWNVEELFHRAKKGGVVSWGPSHQWADNSLRLHTFATVIGLMLVSLARLTLVNRKSASGTMKTLVESHFGPCGHERAWPTSARRSKLSIWNAGRQHFFHLGSKCAKPLG